MQKATNLFFILAIPVCGYANNSNADSSIFYLSQAKLYKLAGKSHETDACFKKAIEFSVNKTNPRLQFVDHLIEGRKYFVALEQLQKIFATDENNAMALAKGVEISFLLHRWKDVLKYINRIPENDQTARILYILGKAYFTEEDYGLAEKALLKSQEKNGSDLDVIILLGQVNIEVSNYKMALFYYNRGIELDPHNNNLLYEFGLLHYTLNHEKEAIRYMELAAEKGYPATLDYKENLGMAYLSVDLTRGVEILNEVLAKKPQDSEISFQIAQAHLKAKNYQLAADIYFKIWQNDNDNTKALYMTGISYQKKGDRTLGNSYCEQAIKLNPELGGLKQMKWSF